MFKWLPVGIVGGAVVLAILNLLAFEGFWYWRFWWFDILMHILGGVVISLFILWFYSTIDDRGITESPEILVFTLSISSIILIGLFWELFEFTTDAFNRPALIAKGFAAVQTGVVDTLSDLLSDILGALIGSLIFLNLCPRRK